ncbi:hypothetical protein NMG60_11014166 [Bertholletia excelsa]
MQGVSGRFLQHSMKQSAAISSFKSIYQLSDHFRKGTGGRSSFFGATGFLGPKMGSQVLVPFRGSEDSPRHLKLMGDLGQIVPMKYSPRDETSIKAVMAKANVVINLIGREYESRNYSFEEVNHYMAEQLVVISKEHGGIPRFIQATIMRPAVMIGTEDQLLNIWAHFAKNYSLLPLTGDGSTKVKHVYVVDVASAIIAALKDDGSSMGKVYELGGPEVFTMHQLVELMYDMIREWPRCVKVPFPITKAIAMPREIFLKKVPFSLPTSSMFNLDIINALTQDTIVSPDALTFAYLCILPHKLKGYPVEFLISHHKGGPQYGSTVSEKLHCKREEESASIELLKLIVHLISMRSSCGSFERVSLEGKNVGAEMTARSGSSGESHNSCNINIYINNNVQGASNSVLLGSEVRMGDPGVCLSLEDVKLGKKSLETDRKRRGSSLGFFGMFLAAMISIFVLSFLF